jgi:hypothetical protein
MFIQNRDWIPGDMFFVSILVYNRKENALGTPPLSSGSYFTLYPSGLVVLPSPLKDPTFMTEDVENSKIENSFFFF